MFDYSKIVPPIILAAMVSLVFTCADTQKKPDEKVGHGPGKAELKTQTATSTAFSETSEGTRIVLVQHCGKCHQSSLETHKPGAVAIFDLDAMEEWHVKLSEKNLEGLGRRTKNNKAITDKEFAVIEEFLALKRAQPN